MEKQLKKNENQKKINIKGLEKEKNKIKKIKKYTRKILKKNR